MELLPSGMDSAIQMIIREAYALFKLYRARDGERKTFAMFMQNVGKVLESVKADVPPYAEPVVRELGALVGVASDKLSKYDSRSAAASLWNIRSETERMRSIMQNVQQLLPLLTVSVASAANVSTAVAELQSRAVSLQDSSCEAAVHLSHLQATVESMASTTATVADIQQCMATMHDSMLQLNADSTQKVVEGCVALQLRLGEGLEQLMDAVDVLQLTVDSFSRQMLTMQREMSADIEQIKGCLERFCGMPAGAAASMQSGRILEALDELAEADGSAAAANNETLAAALKEAISKGRLAVTACLVLGVPLMPEGPLRPVTLPCCGFTVSHTGAQQLVRDRQCTLCHAPLAEDALLEENETVSKVVSAESHGYAPRLVRSSEVTLGKRLGAGGEGTVQEGWLGGRRVAVKQVPLPAGAGAKEMAAVKQVVSTSYIAGVASPHVCKLHGYCWTDSDLWLLMELCEGSLADLVPRAKQQCKLPGLPPLDLITLGLMLCSALDAVHRSARCLHLDVTPGNVLLAPSSNSSTGDGGDGGAAQHSVRLADFGLAKRLPTCVRSSITTAMQTMVKGVAKGTPGYASKEQLLGNAQRRSDVYSMGATLLYAATGAHPYGGDTLEAIFAKLFSGIPIPVPAYVEPPALKQLITSMTAIEAADRPPLASVQQQLMAIQVALLAEGYSTRYIAFGDRHLSAGMRAQPPPLGLASTSAAADLEAVPEQPLAVVSAPVTEQTIKTSEPAVATSDTQAHESQQPAVKQMSTSSDLNAGEHELEPAQLRDAGALDTRALDASTREQSSDTVHGARPKAEVQEDIRNIHTVGQLFCRLDASSPGHVFSLGFRLLADTDAVVAAVKGRDFSHLLPAWQPPTKSKAIIRKAVPSGHERGAAGPRMGVVLDRGGATVDSACLQLSQAGAIILEGTSDTVFRNCVIQGGYIICGGPNCRLALHGVTLDHCKLIVHGGATAELHATTARHSGTSMLNGHAVVVTGVVTNLRVSDTHIWAAAGIAVEERATLIGAGMQVHGSHDAAVPMQRSATTDGSLRSLPSPRPAPEAAAGAPAWARQASVPAPARVSAPACGHSELDARRLGVPPPPVPAQATITSGCVPVKVTADHQEDITGVETLAHLVSILPTHLVRDFIFPVGDKNCKHLLSLDDSSLLNRAALLKMASVLGLKVGKMPTGKLFQLRVGAGEHADTGFLQTHSSSLAAEAQRGVVLFQSRVTIANARLQLSRTGVIMLDGTSSIQSASDTVLSNVDIEGGMLFCHGRHCRLVLDNVALYDCTLVVSGGAHATVRNTTATMTRASSSAEFRDHAVLVTGAGSTLAAEDLAVETNRGIAVEDGGAVTTVRTHVNRAPDLIEL